MYRKIGTGEHERIADQPVASDREAFEYTNNGMDMPLSEGCTYHVTAVGLSGMESHPSSEVVLPTGFTWGDMGTVLNLSLAGEGSLVMPTFTWDAMAGAASWFLDIYGPEGSTRA